MTSFHINELPIVLNTKIATKYNTYDSEILSPTKIVFYVRWHYLNNWYICNSQKQSTDIKVFSL